MKIHKKWFLFVPVAIVYVTGLFMDVMQVDAAQYAAMSLEMAETGNYLQLYYRGQDYIDKPPLIFWLSAGSFKLLGVSNFSYKLPSFLFTLLGLFATFKLGKLLYNANVGFYACLILSTTQAWFLINHDIRTDTILAACTIVSIWQLACFTENRKLIHLFCAALGITGAMLTKGPIGLMVPALAVGTHYVLTRNWKKFFQWEWLLLLFIVFIGLAPMLYGLYQQFDLQPGKQTYNGPIHSGLQFYFWTQSFGRITGESTWKNDADPLFFVHTFLWAFLPWCLVFVVALYKKMKLLVRQRFRLSSAHEGFTLGGIIFPGIAFSLSHYKLPHYIFVFFPLAAILCAHLVYKLIDKQRYKKITDNLTAIHGLMAFSVWFLMVIMCTVVFPTSHLFHWIVLAASFTLILYSLFFKRNLFHRLVIPVLVSIVTANLLLNVHIYPTLLTYQAGSVAAQTVANAFPTYPFVSMSEASYSLDFYYRAAVPNLQSVQELREHYHKQRVWIYTNEGHYQVLKKSEASILNEKKLQDYPVSRLRLRFLDPTTRNNTVANKYLLLVQVE
jgi:4-amino-4-deoxy-L-arabinose transferase-like glycosyltransferase